MQDYVPFTFKDNQSMKNGLIGFHGLFALEDENIMIL
jgi:hypothetical protein